MISAIFLDRDGVINKKIEDDYVRSWADFSFNKGVLEALYSLRQEAQFLIIVTNQRGIYKGVMTEEDLHKIHDRMLAELKANHIYIDAVYFCPDDNGSPNRKPAPGMGLKSKADFPAIEFDKSLMVGDSISDLEFGNNLGMRTVWISDSKDMKGMSLCDRRYSSLASFSADIAELSKLWFINKT